jgi:hypothetical protein
MVIVCIVASGFITIRDRAEMYSAFAELTLSERPLRFLSRIEQREGAQHFQPPPIRIPTEAFIMPRLRGKSRRGAAWYRAESRRKRIQKFEKALVLASIRRKRRSWSTPMAIVEQISPEEAMQYQPPVAEVAEHAHLERHSAAHLDFPPHCIVEEEIPPGDTTGTERSKEKPTRPKGDHKAEAEGSTGRRKHDDEGELDQPALSEPWHLPLVFELRSMLGDLGYRLDRMEQRMDMLFAAFSKTTPKKQCPTCAQEFAIPAGWRRTGYKRASSSKQPPKGPG